MLWSGNRGGRARRRMTPDSANSSLSRHCTKLFTKQRLKVKIPTLSRKERETRMGHLVFAGEGVRATWDRLTKPVLVCLARVDLVPGQGRRGQGRLRIR